MNINFKYYLDDDDQAAIFGITAASQMAEEVTVYVNADVSEDNRGNVDVDICEVRLIETDQDSCVLSEVPANILEDMQSKGFDVYETLHDDWRH